MRVAFHDGEGERFFVGPVSRVTFGAGQYVWQPNAADGRARPDGPPIERREPGGRGVRYRLPAASITVLRGKIQ